jgi:signal transduction histidine kinase
MTPPPDRLRPLPVRRTLAAACAGAPGAWAGFLPTVAFSSTPGLAQGGADGALPLGLVALGVFALAALATLAGLGARRLIAGARRADAPTTQAPDAPGPTLSAAQPQGGPTAHFAALAPANAPAGVPHAPLAGAPARLPGRPGPPTAGASFDPAIAPESAAPPPHTDTRTQLDTIRRLSRDVYWEQDAHGTITRVDDGPFASPLKLRLGRRRWDDGALPLSGGDWAAHRACLDRREPFADLAWVWSDTGGRVRVAIDSGLPRHDAHGHFIGYAGVSRDAGADTVAERARRLATAALLAASEPVLWIEATPGGQPGWRVIWANATACRLFDRTERELRELPCGTLFGSGSPVAAGSVEQSLRARRDCRLFAEIARKYGETRSVEVRLEPLPGDVALRACAALLIHDRSADQERLREDSRAIERLRTRMRERTLELEVTAKELESFTYTVSHDLRAPIRVVDGFARILQEDYGDRIDRVGHDHLQRILGAATRMTQMIDALLGLSRLSGQPIVPEQVDLSRLADMIAEELRAGDPQRRAAVTVQPGMRVEGDRTLLRALLENLLGNAWKYTGRRPEAAIGFSASGDGPDTVYCVSDNGEGFDMRFADRLFGVFQRLHSAADFPGTGVGLATAQRIVRRHGGRIWAESEPGRGSRFYFTLWEKTAR